MESYLTYVKLTLPRAVVDVGAYEALDGIGGEITGVNGTIDDTITTNSQNFCEL
jgi:hypothetical protein